MGLGPELRLERTRLGYPIFLAIYTGLERTLLRAAAFTLSP